MLSCFPNALLCFIVAALLSGCQISYCHCCMATFKNSSFTNSTEASSFTIQWKSKCTIMQKYVCLEKRRFGSLSSEYLFKCALLSSIISLQTYSFAYLTVSIFCICSSNTFRIFDETLPERLDPVCVYQKHNNPARDPRESETRNVPHPHNARFIRTNVRFLNEPIAHMKTRHTDTEQVQMLFI